MNRATMLANMPMLLQDAKDRADARERGQVGLFDSIASTEPEQPLKFVEVPELSLSDRLWYERWSTKAFWSGHPLDLVPPEKLTSVTHTVAEVESLQNYFGDIVVAGLIGNIWVNRFSTNLVLEDRSGRIEVTAKADTAQQYAFLMRTNMMVLARLEHYRGEREGIEVLKFRKLQLFENVFTRKPTPASAP